jgi:hypothetical protein
MPAPYQTVLNLGQDLVGAIANVQQFQGQPLELVGKPLRAAIKAGKLVVNLAGAPLAVNAEYWRARRQIDAALKSNPNRAIYIVAYSWGTVPARQLLTYLDKRGANVQRVAFLDAIHLMNPRTPFNPRRMFDLSHRRLLVPVAFRDRTYVYRQSESGLLKLRGEAVLASDGTFVPGLDVCADHPEACSHGAIRTADSVVDDILASVACCGNGSVDAPDEQCDNGVANSDTAPDACRTDCKSPHCGDGVVDVVHNEQCDGTDDSACVSGQCIAAGQTNECQCQPPDLSGTWTTCLESYTTPPSVATMRCYPCPCPPDYPPGSTGCGGSCTNDGWGAEALPLPFCFALGFFGPQAIHVTQSGTSLSGSVTTASCPATNTCIDTLTGSISGNTVSVVRTLTISGSVPPATQVMTYSIEGTLIPPASIVGSTFSGNIITHIDFECSTYDESGSLGTGTASISISPGP